MKNPKELLKSISSRQDQIKGIYFESDEELISAGDEIDERDIIVNVDFGTEQFVSNYIDGVALLMDASSGKIFVSDRFKGKLSLTFSLPGKGIVKYNLNPDFIRTLLSFKYFIYRNQGKKTASISSNDVNDVLQWVFDQSDDFIFNIEIKPDCNL